MFSDSASNSPLVSILESILSSKLMKCVLPLSLIFSAIQGWGASRIDADFILKRQLNRGGGLESTRAQNQIEFLYKKVLSQSMYSECQWYPSDSQYMNIATRQCGALKGSLLAISRFMMESDAHRLTGSLVHDFGDSEKFPRLQGAQSDSGRIRFQWVPKSADWESSDCPLF